MKPKNACWWNYSKQCVLTPCRDCYLFTPIIRGQLDKPDLQEFTQERMKQCLYDAFVKKATIIKRTKKSVFPKLKLSKEERERFILSLKDALRNLS
jgi:hypothetical protein